ncbi:MAG: hypothetical protein RL685_3464 [Pseudomonadota bacterium]
MRLAILVAATVLTLLALFSNARSEEAMAEIAWLCCAFVCYLAPTFVSARTDVFSPPGLTGLHGGLATAAMMAMVAEEGGTSFVPLGFLPEAARMDLVRKAAILMIVAQLSYLVGYYRSSGRVASRLFPSFAKRRWDGGRLLFVIVLTTLICIPLYMMFQRKMGSSILDVTDLRQGKEIIREDPTRSWMVRGVLFAFVPVLLLASAAIMDRSRRLLALTLAVYLVVAVLVTRLGPRAPAVMAGLTILILFHHLWRKVRLSLVLAMLFSALLMVNILGEYRSKIETDTSFAERMAAPATALAVHEHDRHRLNVLGVILHYFPDRQDYLLGRSYVALPLFWIPRWLWPEKMDYFEWRETNIVPRLVELPAPTPYHAVLYANFSWLGVIVGMGLFGAFHRGLAQYRESSPRDAGVTLLYSVIAVNFTPTFLGLSSTVQYALPLTVLLYAVTRRDAPKSIAQRGGATRVQPSSPAVPPPTVAQGPTW